jgi:threonine/homoserine/homoserine lactone efflux protein
VFFVVFLPQFIPPGTSPFGMTLLLGGIQAVEALIWYLGLGAIAGGARVLLGRPAIRRVLDGLTAAIFAFFGARLALDA